MVVVSILPHAEFRPNDHRKYAPYFIFHQKPTSKSNIFLGFAKNDSREWRKYFKTNIVWLIFVLTHLYWPLLETFLLFNNKKYISLRMRIYCEWENLNLFLRYRDWRVILQIWLSGRSKAKMQKFVKAMFNYEISSKSGLWQLSHRIGPEKLE